MMEILMRTIEERAEEYALKKCGGIIKDGTKGMIYENAKQEYIKIATEQDGITKQNMVNKTCKMLECIEDYIDYHESGSMCDYNGCPEMDMIFDEEKYRKYIDEE